MLSAEDNEVLTRVGRGTRPGELMRRYWQPIAAVAQLDESLTKAVRLMGEDLVLYKDTRGRYGLIDRHCATQASQDRIHRIRVGLRLPAGAGGHDRGRRPVDGRPRLPLAELPLYREIRVAGSDRRRDDAPRGLVQRPRARARAFRAGPDPLLVRPDQRPADRSLDHHPCHEPGLRRLAGQGRIADRTQEHLGESDRGVILLRKRMLEEAAVVARGGEPKAVIRDPTKNQKLALPRVRRGRGSRSIALQPEGPPGAQRAGAPDCTD